MTLEDEEGRVIKKEITFRPLTINDDENKLIPLGYDLDDAFKPIGLYVIKPTDDQSSNFNELSFCYAELKLQR